MGDDRNHPAFRHERVARLSGAYGLPSNSFRMKRAVSLPNTINNVSLPPIPPSQHHRYSGHTAAGHIPPLPPASHENSSNKVMEMSTSSSSGYSSMGSLVFVLSLTTLNYFFPVFFLAFILFLFDAFFLSKSYFSFA